MDIAYFPRAFFDLNYRFAARASALSKLPLAEALRRYTHLYLSFGLGRSFDPLQPAWVDFAKGLSRSADPVDWIFQTYLRLTGGNPPPPPVPAFGVFSYSVWEGGRIRLHFWGGPQRVSTLSRDCLPQRLEELRALVADVCQNAPGARSMVGGSWLYHIEAYRRLFPPAFLATAQPEDPDPQFIALWGQFLDHQRQVKPGAAQPFLARVEQARSLDALLHAFPYPVLRLECPIHEFITFYAPQRASPDA